MVEVRSSLFFFFNDTATTEIYTLSLHDALPICGRHGLRHPAERRLITGCRSCGGRNQGFVVCRDSTRGWPHLACEAATRSEEHTSELQSQSNLVCRLLLGKKKNNNSHLDHAEVC